ncbi:MAG TPA: Xaa-Pro peptidase family protein [Anaerolineae bacterium]|nr:Xaa-Pro peptidase family protein [Anaerolineae bacterium]
MKTTYRRRLDNLALAQNGAGVDLAAIVPGANLRYLTGLEMHTSERITLALFPQDGQPAFVLPVLEAPRVEANLGIEASFYTYSDERGPGTAFQQVAGDLRLEGKVLGVEHLRMRVLELRQLEKHAGDATFVDAGPLLFGLRIVKDKEEIEALRRAAEVNEGCFRQVMDHIKPGVTEQELASVWQRAVLEAENSQLSDIPTIVASGPNGASPHTTATSRRLQNSDLVTIDAFLLVDGYFSDITRTYAVGEPEEELARVYSVVQEANAAARDFIEPGVRAEEVDAAARQVIEGAGYGEYFIHRTGHGMGLEIHEEPNIVEGNDLLLRQGMVFTVEPGIYLPGRGGVRIEDNVVVTETGCETLTTLPRELIRL